MDPNLLCFFVCLSLPVHILLVVRSLVSYLNLTVCPSNALGQGDWLLEVGAMSSLVASASAGKVHSFEIPDWYNGKTHLILGT